MTSKSKKIVQLVIGASITLFSFSTLAQQANLTDRLRNASARVNDLIQSNANYMSTQDQRTVLELLRQVRDVVNNGSSTEPNHPPVYPPNHNHWEIPLGPLTCDSGNNVLLDGRFKLVYDFSNLNDCEEAIRQINYGAPFCDSSNNTLRQPNGKLIYDFGSLSNCKLGIERVTVLKPFCDYSNNTLREPNGNLLYDFSSEADCTAAMRRY